MAKALVSALGGDPKIVEGYGKGAIVGQAGELEHGALWHVPAAMPCANSRQRQAIVASTKKWAAPARASTCHHPHQCFLRAQHFDSMEVGIADAPKANELCWRW